jgi:hypothetical protein
MNRRDILEREQRWQRWAAITAISAGPLLIASTVVRRAAAVPFDGVITEQFRIYHDASGTLLISSILASIGILMTVGPLLYLFKAAQARSDRVNIAMIGFVFIGPVLLAIQGLVGWAAQTNVASDFVAQSSSGGDIYNLLDDLINNSTLSQFSASLAIPAGIGFVVATVYVPLWAMRTGLLTRATATLGMALGVSTLILPPGLLGLVIWFGWVGFVFIDRVPKGKPPAWAAGEAIPWPKPGEQPTPAMAGAGTNGDVVDGDATEAFSGSDPQDHSARRERARKRKRKRRR